MITTINFYIAANGSNKFGKITVIRYTEQKIYLFIFCEKKIAIPWITKRRCKLTITAGC